MNNSLSNQRGVALIIVLMVVALVSVLATDMATRLQLQVQRAINIKDNNQAYWYAIGAEEFARKSIDLLMEENRDKIALDQPWTQEFMYPVDGGTISATLEDMQSCFNLNAILATGNNNANNNTNANTVNNSPDNKNKAKNKNKNNPRSNRNAGINEVTPAMDAFHRLLLSSELDITNFVADTVRDSLADWLDEDDRMRPYGAEDSEYESREFPYLAANGLMYSQSELRLIHGVEVAWLNEILPYVCVIPGVTELKINVNTITEERAPVLAGLTGLSLQQAKNLIASRPQEGWDDVSDFNSEPDIAALSLTVEQQAWFTVSTEYFILHTKTRYNKATFKLTSVFHAPEGEKVRVIRREFGEIN
ncbi:type II secretion system minor pseudopilin GspK [Alteromonas sp. ASW11-130]|uniref:type II secretion system minor pseudopilin GspK n=1 Tax=Alteromonas sp. ASW11-130 TaxID=3015775 RepID=UPI002241FECC|nr:type II secretion system minor pseudopilin GspK [Alteromonas sp. ASW11-130]MCW8093275.1 type II secretion system minor pseudopilin GspK [Alteromonas sp. ASW11-130]